MKPVTIAALGGFLVSFLFTAHYAAAQSDVIHAASSSSGTCAVDVTAGQYSPSYRATTLSGTEPGFSCDGLLPECVRFGPGLDTGCGVNTAGEVECGRVGQTTGVWRWWGSGFASLFSGTNVRATNQVEAGAVYDFGNTAFMRNTNPGKAPLVDDPEGFRIKPVTALQPCTADTMNGNIIPLAPAAGAGTGLKLCLCESDYAETPVYRWKNIQTGTRGTTTTDCP